MVPNRHAGHLDTDLGGDTDDLFALAWLLRRDDVDLLGITTNTDPSGARVGLIRHVLELVGREEVPTRGGAGDSISGTIVEVTLYDADRYWGRTIPARVDPPGEALDLLEASVSKGATLIAIGPFTNFGLLEILRPASLARADVALIGGSVNPPPNGFPRWGAEFDYNSYQDVQAAKMVFDLADPLVVPIEMSIQFPVTEQDARRLETGDELARLLARQARAYGADNGMAELAAQHPALPKDLLNFQHDVLACMAAFGVEGITVERVPLKVRTSDGLLRLSVEADGKPTRVVTSIDAPSLRESWLHTVLAER